MAAPVRLSVHLPEAQLDLPAFVVKRANTSCAGCVRIISKGRERFWVLYRVHLDHGAACQWLGKPGLFLPRLGGPSCGSSASPTPLLCDLMAQIVRREINQWRCPWRCCQSTADLPRSKTLGEIRQRVRAATSCQAQFSQCSPLVSAIGIQHFVAVYCPSGKQAICGQDGGLLVAQLKCSVVLCVSGDARPAIHSQHAPNLAQHRGDGLQAWSVERNSSAKGSSQPLAPPGSDALRRSMRATLGPSTQIQLPRPRSRGRSLKQRQSDTSQGLFHGGQLAPADELGLAAGSPGLCDPAGVIATHPAVRGETHGTRGRVWRKARFTKQAHQGKKGIETCTPFTDKDRLGLI